MVTRCWHTSVGLLGAPVHYYRSELDGQLWAIFRRDDRWGHVCLPLAEVAIVSA